MKKITNREEANNYYKLVNKAVDDFTSKTKARPSETYKYLSRNGRSFLKQVDLSDVVGIENVLTDVLLHKKHLEDDKIVTFEKFTTLNENIINVGSPTVEQEKLLADLFNTSVGHVDIVDPQLHIFKVNDFGEERICVVFSEDDLNRIKVDVLEQIKKTVVQKEISLLSLSGVDLSNPLKFWVSDFFDEQKMEESLKSKITIPFLLELIESNLKLTPEYNLVTFSFVEKDAFYIWYSEPDLDRLP